MQQRQLHDGWTRLRWLSEVPASVGAVIELPELLVPDVAAWHAWLVENHDDEPGVRLVLHKKGETVTTLTYNQALDEALVEELGPQLPRADHGGSARDGRAERLRTLLY